MAWSFVQLVKSKWRIVISVSVAFTQICSGRGVSSSLRSGVFVVHGGRQSAAGVCLLDLLLRPRCYVS
jgi:hypothetical protein